MVEPVALSKPSRRLLRFETNQQILDDCDRLAEGECLMLGNWTLAQIVSHLAQGIDCFYDGFGFQGPWWMRRVVGPLVRQRILTRGMRSGISLPSTATMLLPRADPDLPVALEHLRAGLARLEREPPRHPHAYLGWMTHEQVRQLMLRHAELHLSFAIPVPKEPEH